MIFNKCEKLLKYNFTYRGSPLEIGGEYLYPGILFTSDGSFSKAVSRLCNHANKALFKLRQLNLRGVTRWE